MRAYNVHVQRPSFVIYDNNEREKKSNLFKTVGKSNRHKFNKLLTLMASKEEKRKHIKFILLYYVACVAKAINDITMSMI